MFCFNCHLVFKYFYINYFSTNSLFENGVLQGVWIVESLKKERYSLLPVTRKKICYKVHFYCYFTFSCVCCIKKVMWYAKIEFLWICLFWGLLSAQNMSVNNVSVCRICSALLMCGLILFQIYVSTFQEVSCF